MNLDIIWTCAIVGISGIVVGLSLGCRKRRTPNDIGITDRGIAVSTTREHLASSPPQWESVEPTAELLQILLGIVDAIDEIELMRIRASPAEHGGLSAIQNRLRDLIELSGGELIRETTWQPAIQKAIKVESAESGQTEIRIVQTRATGLKHAGRIIRKQEVVISRPKH